MTNGNDRQSHLESFFTANTVKYSAHIEIHTAAVSVRPELKKVSTMCNVENKKSPQETSQTIKT